MIYDFRERPNKLEKQLTQRARDRYITRHLKNPNIFLAFYVDTITSKFDNIILQTVMREPELENQVLNQHAPARCLYLVKVKNPCDNAEIVLKATTAIFDTQYIHMKWHKERWDILKHWTNNSAEYSRLNITESFNFVSPWWLHHNKFMYLLLDTEGQEIEKFKQYVEHYDI